MTAPERRVETPLCISASDVAGRIPQAAISAFLSSGAVKLDSIVKWKVRGFNSCLQAKSTWLSAKGYACKTRKRLM